MAAPIAKSWFPILGQDPNSELMGMIMVALR